MLRKSKKRKSKFSTNSYQKSRLKSKSPLKSKSRRISSKSPKYRRSIKPKYTVTKSKYRLKSKSRRISSKSPKFRRSIKPKSIKPKSIIPKYTITKSKTGIIPQLWKTYPKNNGKWTIFKSDGCYACTKTIELFDKNNFKYNAKPISGNEKFVSVKTNGYKYVPVILTPSGEFMGGFQEIQKYFKRF
jgi:glutaredoxin-related protein